MTQHAKHILPSKTRLFFWIDLGLINPNTHERSKRSIAAAILAVFCFSTVALAADVTLTWDANDEPELEGYKIYYKIDSPGPPYDGIHPLYPNLDPPVDVGNVTEFTIHDLDENSVYYFVVTAYNSAGFESGYSNEVSTEYPDDNAGEFRSAWSGSEGEETGCFIQNTKKDLPTIKWLVLTCVVVCAAVILLCRESLHDFISYQSTDRLKRVAGLFLKKIVRLNTFIWELNRGEQKRCISRYLPPAGPLTRYILMQRVSIRWDRRIYQRFLTS